MTLRWLLLATVLLVPPAQAADRASVEYARNLADAVEIIADTHIDRPTRVQMLQWAVTGLYKELKEKLPPGTAARIAKLDGASKAELLLALQDIRSALGESQKLNEGRDLDISLAAVFAELEPGAQPVDRSSYTSEPQLWEEFLPVAGVGLKLKSDPDSGLIQVVTPMFGGPAYKAGIRAGDLIVAIQREVNFDGKPLPKREVISTKGMSVEEVAKLILGPPGTEITLRVIPASRAKDAPDRERR